MFLPNTVITTGVVLVHSARQDTPIYYKTNFCYKNLKNSIFSDFFLNLPLYIPFTELSPYLPLYFLGSQNQLEEFEKQSFMSKFGGETSKIKTVNDIYIYIYIHILDIYTL